MEVANKLIIAFVALMIGAVLIGTIASNSNDVSELKSVENEAYDYTAKMAGVGQVNVTLANHTVTNAPTGWKITDCPLEHVVVTNGSGTALTLNTDYRLVASTGTIAMLNTTATNSTNNNNVSYIDYDYCGDDYLNSSWGRTVILLVAGFFAIALLLVAVALFFSVGKDTGII